MRTLPFLAALQASCLFAFAQYPHPPGTLRVEVIPPVIRPGDSVRVEVGVFSPGLCPYRSTYVIRKDSVKADQFTVLIHSDSTGGKCASAFGFSGPSLFVVPEGPGTYLVRFDSTSPFRPDPGDLALFRVLAPVSLRGPGRKPSFRGQPLAWRLDGRRRPGGLPLRVP